MSRVQVAVVAIMFVLNALDGFDILSISFAAPGIAAEWGIDRARLGIVLSMELFGMALGSVFLGRVADRVGRRRTILGCLVAMSLGMFMATTVSGLVDLSVWRVVTGLGIGGMLAAINAQTAEFSSLRRRHLCVSLMAIGYPIGVIFGGAIAAQLLKTHDWRSVFYLGFTMTVVCIPLVYFLVPESVYWLSHKQPAGALDRINRLITRMGHAAVSALPPLETEPSGRRSGDIFSSTLIATTLILAVAYFFHVTTFYYIIKWVPKLVVDMGFAASSAAQVLVWSSVGGATGGAVIGLLTLRYNVKALTIGVFVLSSVMVMVFGRVSPDLLTLSAVCAGAGFCINAGIVGMYAIFAQAYPTRMRASGTGFAVGVGRGGSVLAPIVAGFLFEAGITLPVVSIIMSFGSLMAAGFLLLLRLQPYSSREAGADH